MATYTFFYDGVDIATKLTELDVQLQNDIDLGPDYSSVSNTGSIITVTFTTSLSRPLYLALKKMVRIIVNGDEIPDATNSTIFKADRKDLLRRSYQVTTAPNAVNDIVHGYNTGSIATSMDSAYICLDNTQNNAVWLQLGPGITGPVGLTGAGGLAMFYDFKEEFVDPDNTGITVLAQSSGSNVYIPGLTLATPANLPAGDYRINWYYNWAKSNNSNDFHGRVQLDGNTIHIHEQEARDPGIDQAHAVSGFQNVTLTAGVHDIVFEIARESSGTSFAKNIRVDYWRIA